MRRDSIKATCADAAAIREVRSPLGGRIARWAPVPLRLIVGYGFMEHGFAKLGRGPEAFADILHAIGVPALQAPVTGSQVSTPLQALPSLHTIGVPALQAPVTASQVSTPLHAFPSEQSVPDERFVKTQPD